MPARWFRSHRRAPRPRRGLLPLVAAAAVAAAVLVPGGLSAAAAPAPSATVTPTEIRVVAPSAAQVKRLSEAYDLLEVRRGKDLFVMGDDAALAALRSEGFNVRVEKRYAPIRNVRGTSASAIRAAAVYPTFFGGYHTVAAHRQHLQDVANTYTSLTTLVDYGDSWLKTQGRGGHDLYAICITNKTGSDCARTTTGHKPRSFVYAAIHARELATAEIAWNWIDYLVTGYGTNTTVTNLLNTTEVWVIPVANPDGRQIVESGGSSPYFQRKNANDSRGSCARPPTSTNQHGVDMNRNATWAWGGVGSSSSTCSQTYRGTTAASEPETSAQQALFNSLYADRRGTSRSSAAPADTTGTFMSYHSYAGLRLFPWGDTTTDAPNGAQLRSLALAMESASSSVYTVGQGPEILYATTGTTDDDIYGRLGVASFTTELGASGTSCDGFMPPYTCVGSRFWPQELSALLVLAQEAATPYR